MSKKIHFLQHLQFNFQHPRLVRHRSQRPSCRRRRSKSKIDELIQRIRYAHSLDKLLDRDSCKDGRKQFMEDKKTKEAKREAVRKIKE